MYSFKFNNRASSEFPAFVVNRPNIPVANEDVTTYKIPGRNGTLIVREGTYPDIPISIPMVYKSTAEEFAETFRNLKDWLFSKVDNKLSFSDDEGFFYLVKNVTLSENKRTKRYIGNFTVTFTCEAYQYHVSGSEFLNVENSLFNPYDQSHPVYKITGEGVCVLTVNGNRFTVNVGQNVSIDTGRMITFREDGTIQNTISTGDYEDLYLNNGNNTISITEGFKLKVKPQWGKL